MDVTNQTLDESKFRITDEFLIDLVNKDLQTGLHYYYIKIDKRNLVFFDNNQEKMLEHFKKAEEYIIHRYAGASFSEEQKKTLMIFPPNIEFIQEKRDEEEKTDWLVCKVVFAFTDQNHKDRAIANFVGIKTIKHDFSKPIMVDEEFRKNHPELNDLKEDELTTISLDEANRILADMKEKEEKENKEAEDSDADS